MPHRFLLLLLWSMHTLQCLGMLACTIFYRYHMLFSSFWTVLIAAYVVYALAKLNDMIGVEFFGTSRNKCLVYLGSDDVIYSGAGVLMSNVNTIIFVILCRGRQSERGGLTYLLLSSIVSIAGSWSYIFADYAYDDLWDVSDTTLEDHEYSGYQKLQLFTTLVTMLGLLSLPLIPDKRSDMHDGGAKEVREFPSWDSVSNANKAVAAAILLFYFVSIYGVFTFGWLSSW